MRASAVVFSLFACAAALVLGGRVSEQITPEYKPKMGVVQNSDGSVVFALQTRAGYEYEIKYLDPRTNGWKTMPGCERIRGTGETIEIQKNFNSRGPLPAFTVRHTKLN